MKTLMAFLLLATSTFSFANTWSQAAVPTQIDVDRAYGFMVYGNFDNPNDYTIGGRFYVSIDHPQYENLYNTALIAFAHGKKLQAFIHECGPVAWYTGPEITFNILEPRSTLIIKH